MDKQIVVNSSWLIISQAAAKIIAFFYTVFLANQLGVSNFGLWILVLSYFSLFSSIGDFGLTRYFLREASKSATQAAILIPNVVFSRLILLVIIILIFTTIILILDPQVDRRTLSILGAIAVLPQSVSITLDALFIARLKNYLSAVGTVFLNISSAIIGVILVTSGLGIYGAVLALVFSQIFYSALMIVIAIRNGYWPDWKMQWAILPDILKESFPYGILGAMGLIFFKVDSIMLSLFRGNYETGIYGAAYKFLEASLIVPNAVSFSIFPIMAKLHLKDIKLMKPLYTNTLLTMALVGTVTAILFVIILPLVINILLPQYKQSIGVIKILALALPFMFMHVTMSQAALSSAKYLKPLILLSVFTLLFNIILNLIFIPIYGYIAASWITVISDITSFLVIYITFSKLIFKDYEYQMETE
ncbi:flippase [Patescibacteria group bacterium]|nr:flippase [Patescibacteria group bacterium]MCL5409764.1 flippase [Patescibacteria group bacterium]